MTRRPSLVLLHLAVLTALVFAAAATRVSAATPITSSFTMPCPAYGDQHVCSGEVPSYDGTPLDVDLTLPENGAGGDRHPLIVMLHGFGNDKHERESTTNEGDGADKWHWNSHWFAQHGYYVLTYTARGFKSGDGPDYAPKTPPGTSAEEPNGRIRLKSREWEVRDTQYLAALVADGYRDVDPDRVAVTGGSYGGGESWVQASQADWAWAQKFGLPALKLQVAVPKYPWTDLAYSLAPNGHPGPRGEPGDPIYESAQGDPSSDTGEGNPVGVPKASYITGLFATGAKSGNYERAEPPSNQAGSEEGQIDVPLWVARIMGTDPYSVGEPYAAEDPIIKQIRRGLTEFRSAYYQDEGWAAQKDARK